MKPVKLLGLCLWDVFSDNHDVIAADGRVVHLGSFRGSEVTIDRSGLPAGVEIIERI